MLNLKLSHRRFNDAIIIRLIVLISRQILINKFWYIWLCLIKDKKIKLHMLHTSCFNCDYEFGDQYFLVTFHIILKSLSYSFIKTGEKYEQSKYKCNLEVHTFYKFYNMKQFIEWCNDFYDKYEKKWSVLIHKWQFCFSYRINLYEIDVGVVKTQSKAKKCSGRKNHLYISDLLFNILYVFVYW